MESMVSTGGGIVIAVVVILLIIAVGWVVFTQLRARRLGVSFVSFQDALPSSFVFVPSCLTLSRAIRNPRPSPGPKTC